jgi:hypothetical protein
MTMQYGLGIIFETQLSHKTKIFQRSEDRRQKSEIRGQGLLNLNFGRQNVECDIKPKAQGLRIEMILFSFALSLKLIFDLSGFYLSPL